ncbi:ankyrin repeat domain-containing protein [Candidatus Jidaibacter acanthamoebae]|nr:ankyrin repeat domain-containing protein [Candidatus Jidaibacter acanthamoeba]
MKRKDHPTGSSEEFSSGEEEVFEYSEEHSSYELIEESLSSGDEAEEFKGISSPLLTSEDDKNIFCAIRPLAIVDIDIFKSSYKEEIKHFFTTLKERFLLLNNKEIVNFFYRTVEKKEGIFVKRAEGIESIKETILNSTEPLSTNLAVSLKRFVDILSTSINPRNDICLLAYDEEGEQLITEFPKELFIIEWNKFKKTNLGKIICSEDRASIVEIELKRLIATPEYNFRVMQTQNQRVAEESDLFNVKNITQLGTALSRYKVIGFNDYHGDKYIIQTITKLMPTIQASFFCIEIESYRQSRIDEWYDCQDDIKQASLDILLLNNILGGSEAYFHLFLTLKESNIRIKAMDIHTETQTQFGRDSKHTAGTTRMKEANAFFIDCINNALEHSQGKTVIFCSGAKHNRDLQDRLDAKENVGRSGNIIISIKKAEQDITNAQIIISKEFEMLPGDKPLANALTTADISIYVPVNKNELCWENDNLNLEKRSLGSLKRHEDMLEINVSEDIYSDFESLFNLPSLSTQTNPILNVQHYDDKQIEDLIKYYNSKFSQVPIIAPETSIPEIMKDGIPVGGATALEQKLLSFQQDKALDKIIIVLRVNAITKGFDNQANNHYVCIYLEKHRSKKITITYIDPMGENIHHNIEDIIHECLENNFKYKMVLNRTNRIQIYDVEEKEGVILPVEGTNDHDCGPFLIYLVSLVINKLELPNLISLNVDTSKALGQLLRQHYAKRTDFDTIDKEVKSIIPLNNKSASIKHASIAIFEAAKYGNTKKIEKAITKGVDINYREETHGRTLLHVTIIRGHESISNLLINNDNAALNLQDNDGRSPLHLAAIYNRSEVVRLLLEKGANKEIRDNSGKTAKDYAASYQLKLLLEPKDKGKEREK